jgi:hypothetical protein
MTMLFNAAELQKMRFGDRASIVSVMKEESLPLGPRQIAEACNGKARNIHKMLCQMAKAGVVKRIARGRYVLAT